MPSKRNITPETLRIFSLVLSGILILTINVAFSTYTINKINEITETKFSQNFLIQSEGYAEAVDQILASCVTVPNAFNPDILRDGTSKQIQDYIIRTKNKIPDQYNSLFYADKEGTAYISNGESAPVGDLITFQASLHNKYGSFITTPFKSYLTGKTVIAFAKIVYDRKGQKKGILFATMTLEKFHDIISTLKIGSNQFFVIQDSRGLILYHPDYRKVNKKAPVYLVETIADYTYRLTDKSGKKLIAFDTRIPGTDWTLRLIVSNTEYASLHNTQRFYLVMTIFWSVLLIFLIIVLEIHLTSYFHKKDIIAAVYDPLTNLYTRQQFEKVADRLLRRRRHGKYMLIETDIHGFKFINQNFGVQRADRLIVYYAEAFQKIVEASLGGLAGRGYADHIYALIRITDPHLAIAGFQKELDKLLEKIKSYEIQFFPKFGITFRVPEEGKPEINSVKTLIGQASFAKSTIRDNILTPFAVYDQSLLKKSNEEHYIESHAEQALENKEFFVVYQPKINPNTLKIEGAEALVRWKSPELGLMSPGSFIPLFERNDFIKELDFYVYDQVFAFIQRCLDNDIPVVPISVNMSRNHSNAEEFVDRFMASFKKYNISEKLVEVEILERSVMSKDSLLQITNLLHEKGFSVAMDDFGSGESSLNMLTKIPVDILKYDKSFLDNACPAGTDTPDMRAANLIEGLIMLSKQLDKKCLFEGVETKAQLQILTSLNCDLIQGFYFSKPIPEDQFVEYVKAHI